MKKLFFILLFLPVFAKGQIITTFAGGGTSSPNGVTATSAKIFGPYGGVFDSHGNYYFVEYSSISRVDKIDTLGVITTVVGTGSAGYNGDGGRADTSLLNWPSAVIVDSLDNLYICDHENNRIRKVDAITGLISTVAGNGITGFSGDSSLAINAEFHKPGNICFDKHGNLYIADANNLRVRVVAPSGIITTYAGNGTLGIGGDGGLATLAQVQAFGLCVDDSDNLYVSGNAIGSCRIAKINAITHIITTIAGTDTGYVYNGDNVSALSANMAPSTIRFDNACENLYITDYVNNRIRKIDATGIIHTVAGNGIEGFSGDNGDAFGAELYYPTGLTFDSCGNLYFGDQYNNRIRKVSFNPACWPEKVNNIIATNSLTIFPNPATTYLTIQSSALPITQVTITDLLGQTVYNQLPTANCKSLTVDVSGLPNGMYFVKINDSEVRKFVKE